MKFRGGCFLQNIFNVLVPFVHAVLLAYFDLEEIVLADVRGESRQRLSSRSSDSHEERVTPRLFYYAGYLRQMLDRESEENEIHGFLRHGVVLDEVAFDDCPQGFEIRNFLVQTNVSFRIGEVAEDEVPEFGVADLKNKIGLKQNWSTDHKILQRQRYKLSAIKHKYLKYRVLVLEVFLKYIFFSSYSARIFCT